MNASRVSAMLLFMALDGCIELTNCMEQPEIDKPLEPPDGAVVEVGCWSLFWNEPITGSVVIELADGSDRLEFPAEGIGDVWTKFCLDEGEYVWWVEGTLEEYCDGKFEVKTDEMSLTVVPCPSPPCGSCRDTSCVYEVVFGDDSEGTPASEPAPR